MSTSTAVTETHDDHDHPSDGQYWKVGLALAIITLLEIGTYFITDDPYSHDLAPLLIGSLLVMMVLKFITIGAYFMHLKFDSPIFKAAFIAGLGLAVVLYLGVLTTFSFWEDRFEASQALLTVF